MRINYIMLFLFLSGCSSQETYQAPQYTKRIYTTTTTVGKDTTLAWYDSERAGAAYNKEGYRHVLTKRNTLILADNAPEPLEVITNSPINAIKKLYIKSYSIYETERWERFCGDENMNSEDWKFIAREGRENVPEQLEKHCNPPPYTRQEYINAWKASCDEQVISVALEVIRLNSIAPHNICDVYKPTVR